MLKKLFLITLVPMTLSLNAAFVMKKGQPLKKIEYTQKVEQPVQNETKEPLPNGVKQQPMQSESLFTDNDSSSGMSQTGALADTNPSSKTLKILTIGDSFTDGADILIPLRSLLESKKYKTVFLGTRSNSNIKHEGNGGWTAAAYLNRNPKWYPNSPFLNGKKIDIGYYFENKIKDIPNIVIIQLGINDVMGVAKGIKKGYYRFDEIFKKAKDLYDLTYRVKEALPANSKILVLLPTQSNSNIVGEAPFYNVSSSTYNDLLERYTKEVIKSLKNKKSENIYLVPTNNILNRSTDIYDFVHPNKNGYKKIAKEILEWI